MNKDTADKDYLLVKEELTATKTMNDIFGMNLNTKDVPYSFKRMMDERYLTTRYNESTNYIKTVLNSKKLVGNYIHEFPIFPLQSCLTKRAIEALIEILPLLEATIDRGFWLYYYKHGITKFMPYYTKLLSGSFINPWENKLAFELDHKQKVNLRYIGDIFKLPNKLLLCKKQGNFALVDATADFLKGLLNAPTTTFALGMVAGSLLANSTLESAVVAGAVAASAYCLQRDARKLATNIDDKLSTAERKVSNAADMVGHCCKKISDMVDQCKAYIQNALSSFPDWVNGKFLLAIIAAFVLYRSTIIGLISKSLLNAFLHITYGEPLPEIVEKQGAPVKGLFTATMAIMLGIAPTIALKHTSLIRGVISDIETLLSADGLRTLANFVSKCISGTEIFSDTFEQTIKQLTIDINNFASAQDLRQRLMDEPNLYKKMRELYGEVCCIDHAAIRDIDRSERIEFMKAKKLIVDLYEECKYCDPRAVNRTRPFNIMFGGGSNVGKTTLMLRIMLAYLNHINGSIHKHTRTNIFSYKAAGNFPYQGFIPDIHKGILFDEFMQARDAQSNAKELVDKYLLLEGVPYVADTAFQDKGKKYINPKVCGFTTNNYALEQSGVHNTAAFFKRLDLCFEVKKIKSVTNWKDLNDLNQCWQFVEKEEKIGDRPTGYVRKFKKEKIDLNELLAYIHNLDPMEPDAMDDVDFSFLYTGDRKHIKPVDPDTSEDVKVVGMLRSVPSSKPGKVRYKPESFAKYHKSVPGKDVDEGLMPGVSADDSDSDEESSSLSLIDVDDLRVKKQANLFTDFCGYVTRRVTKKIWPENTDQDDDSSSEEIPLDLGLDKFRLFRSETVISNIVTVGDPAEVVRIISKHEELFPSGLYCKYKRTEETPRAGYETIEYRDHYYVALKYNDNRDANYVLKYFEDYRDTLVKIVGDSIGAIHPFSFTEFKTFFLADLYYEYSLEQVATAYMWGMPSIARWSRFKVNASLYAVGFALGVALMLLTNIFPFLVTRQDDYSKSIQKQEAVQYDGFVQCNKCGTYHFAQDEFCPASAKVSKQNNVHPTVLNKISSNVLIIVFHGKDVMWDSHVLMVDNNTAVVAYHTINEIPYVRANIYDRLGNCIMVFTPEDVNVINFPNEHTTIIDFHTKRLPSITSIRKHFVEQRFLADIGTKTTRLVLSKQDARDLLVNEASITHHTVNQKLYADDGAFNVQYGVVLSKIDNKNGYCGAPYLVRMNSWTSAKIAYIHVGMTGTQKGIASCVSQDMFPKRHITVNKTELVTKHSNFCPVGTSPVGVLEKGCYVPNDSKYAISWFNEPLKEMHGHVELHFPLLGEKPTTALRQSTRFQFQEHPHMPMQYYNFMRANILKWVSQFWPNATYKELTLQEAITGYGKLKKLDQHTAIGYTWRTRGFTKREELIDVNNCTLHPELQNEVEKLYEQVKTGETDEFLVTLALKDEPLPLEKKIKRVFYVYDLHVLIVLRMLYGWVLAEQLNIYDVNSTCIGVNPHSIEWTVIAGRLEQHPNFIEMDYSKFDVRIRPYWFDLFAYAFTMKYPNCNKLAVECTLLALASPLLIANNDAFKARSLVTSGSILTLFFNDFVCQISQRSTIDWFWSMSGNDTEATNEYVLCSYGDDSLMSWSDKLCQTLNLERYTKFIWLMHRLELTGMIKNKPPQICKSLSEVSFISRHFRKVGKFYFAPLKEKSMVRMMKFYQKSSTETDFDVHKAICDTLAFEAIPQGKEYYERLIGLLQPVVNERGLPNVFLPYEQAFVDYLRKYENNMSLEKTLLFNAIYNGSDVH